MKSRFFVLRSLLLLVICAISLSVRAQITETINSDRPGQAISPLVAGRGMFQIQSGFTYENTRDESAGIETVTANGLAYTFNPRMGLTDRLEINSIIAVRRDKLETEIGGQEVTLDGLSTLNFGARYTLLDGSKGISLGLQADISFTAVSEDYEPEKSTPRLLLSHSQNLNDWLTLTTNLGGLVDGNTDDFVGIYIVNFSFPIGENGGAFVEAFANSTDGDFDINFDTGFGYLINNNLQLDISWGYGDNDNSRFWFADAGVSWRFNYNGVH